MRSMRKSVVLLLLLALFASLLPASAAGPNGELALRMYDEETGKSTAVNVSVVNLILDGGRMDFTGDIPPVVVSLNGAGRTLVPVRAVSEALGATVLWSPQNRQAILRKGTTTIVLTLGSATAVVNGKAVPLPDGIPASSLAYPEEDPRTMVPLRFISEQLGAQVSWEQESYTAQITSPEKRVTYITRIAADYDAQTVLIDTDGVPNFKVVDLGDRVAVDLLGAELSAGFPGTITVDNELITAVRYDQHGSDLYPEYSETVRVVLDLKSGITYAKNVKVEAQGTGVLLTTFLTDEDRKDPPDFTPSTPLDPSKKTIVVDAGHGGSAPGAIYEGIKEKDLTLAMAKKLEAILLKMGYNVVMTRDTDVYVDLYDRCDIANAVGADLFVSVHCNASATNRDFAGIFTYYHPSSTRGKKLAEAIQGPLSKATGGIDRGVLKADFVVVRETDMCAVLVETGFMTNHDELMNLKDDAYQTKVAQGIANGVTDYLNSLQ